MALRGQPGRLVAPEGRSVALWPTTRLGEWALALSLASVVLVSGWRFVGRLGGAPGLALGLAGGAVALVAIVSRGERALGVFAALVPFLNAGVFLVGELLVGHD
jgi:hypothetical protein